MIAEESHSSSGGCLLFVALAIVLVAAAIAVPSVGNVTLRAHANQRHGDDAVVVRQWVSTHAEPYHRWDCPDGRTRIVVPYDGHRWAVMVVLGEVEITSFLTDDQAYVTRMLDPCKPGVPFAHP